MSVSIRWHGHATLTVRVDGTYLLVDPFFDENPACITTADNAKADFILITHGHGDHVSDALSIARRTGAKIISNFEICNWFSAKGHQNVHAQHIGGAFNHPFGRLKLTLAFHGSGLPDGSYGGMPAGLLLFLEDKKIYIAGDTALFSDMQLIGREGLDVAVIPIGDNYTMGPEDAVEAVKFLKPSVVIPYHYNTWEPIQCDVEEWAEQVTNETDTKVVVLRAEESYTIP